MAQTDQRKDQSKTMIYLDPALKKRFKAACQGSDVTMQDQWEALAEEFATIYEHLEKLRGVHNPEPLEPYDRDMQAPF